MRILSRFFTETVKDLKDLTLGALFILALPVFALFAAFFQLRRLGAWVSGEIVDVLRTFNSFSAGLLGGYLTAPREKAAIRQAAEQAAEQAPEQTPPVTVPPPTPAVERPVRPRQSRGKRVPRPSVNGASGIPEE